MQLNKFTDLSLRVLMYLSYQERESVVTINEIAEKFNASKNHLIKIVTKLNKAGWIMATRGRNGGLQLAKPTNQLRLGDIISALEHPTLVDCNHAACPIRGECNLKHILDFGLVNFYNEMNRYTLADIVDAKTGSALIKLHQSFSVIKTMQ
ncbi:MAG: Rrf2 family transcriptional regulator [Methylophilaceae bacterium]